MRYFALLTTCYCKNASKGLHHLSLPSRVIVFSRVHANQSTICIVNNKKNSLVLPITYREILISQFKDTISATDPEGFMVNVDSESGVKADCQKLLYVTVCMFIYLLSSHSTAYSCHHSQPRSWQESVHGALKGFIVGHRGNKIGRKS